MKQIIRKIAKIPFLLYLKVHEHNTKEGLKYLFFNRKSKVLAIVFSAFDTSDKRRSYNYVRSLSKIGIDFIFLSDPWGYRGSYYLQNNGSFALVETILSSINQIVNRGGYSSVLTLGTSKGGTAALFYGLKLNVQDIVIGACQYRIGSYVANYPEIFKGMTGKDVNETDINSLNSILPNLIANCKGSQSHIHLVHSVKEPTYERDIKYLIRDLNSYGLTWTEIECGFEKHDDVGRFFIPFASKFLNKYI